MLEQHHGSGVSAVAGEERPGIALAVANQTGIGVKFYHQRSGIGHDTIFAAQDVGVLQGDLQFVKDDFSNNHSVLLRIQSFEAVFFPETAYFRDVTNVQQLFGGVNRFKWIKFYKKPGIDRHR